MYYVQGVNPYPYYANVPLHHYSSQSMHWANPAGIEYTTGYGYFGTFNDDPILIKDYGPGPFVVDINDAAEQNNTFRTALWTGPNLQVTLMSLNAGEEIGLEMHQDTDQFLRIEDGSGIVRMGPSRGNINYERQVDDDSAIFVPAGTWHNLVNTGNVPLKLYTIYAPPHHPFGTVHQTKAEADAAEGRR